MYRTTDPRTKQFLTAIWRQSRAEERNEQVDRSSKRARWEESGFGTYQVWKPLLVDHLDGIELYV